MKMNSKKFDAVVAGAGIAGLCAALALAKAGKKVLIISKEEKGKSTPAAAGILDPFLEMTLHHPLFKLSQKAFRAYPAFIKEIERASGRKTGYKKTGMVYLAFSKAEVREIRSRYAWQKKSQIPVKIRPAKSVLKADPAVPSNLSAGLYYPTIGRVQPRLLTAALKIYLKKKGAVIAETRQFPSLILDKGRVAGIRLAGQRIQSPVVVNATGSWALKKQGLGKPLPVLPARGQILIYEGKEKISTILHSLDGGYIVPWNNGTVKKGTYEYLVGSNVEFSGFKPVMTPGGIAQIRRKNERIFPPLKKCKIIDRWVGLRPFSKKKQPLIGPSKIKGLWHAGGYYRSGILISPYAGKLLAESIISGKLTPELKAFDPRKFSL